MLEFWESIAPQLEYFLRLVVAAVCGAVVGYERKNRLKEAGVRTHLIVALAASLLMIVSKYGFFDMVNMGEFIKLDPSRVASGIVSGIGFLGAGIIFVRKQAISGLTTAAGIWATMGVGMAIGSGMYAVGVASTLLIILAQILLHRNHSWLRIPVLEQFTVEIVDSPEAVAYLQNTLSENKIEVLNIKAEKIRSGFIEVELATKLPKAYDVMMLLELFKNRSYINSIEL